MFRRALAGLGDRLLVLAALAAVLALLVPSHAVAVRSDGVLAALVLFTALTIAPAQLASLVAHKVQLAFLVMAPFVGLVPLAWGISRPFSAPVRDGVLALGVSSTEVAAVGLVALSGGSAVLALGGLAGSLVVAALLNPVLLTRASRPARRRHLRRGPAPRGVAALHADQRRLLQPEQVGVPALNSRRRGGARAGARPARPRPRGSPRKRCQPNRRQRSPRPRQ
jgi:hypothetical protein